MCYIKHPGKCKTFANIRIGHHDARRNIRLQGEPLIQCGKCIIGHGTLFSWVQRLIEFISVGEVKKAKYYDYQFLASDCRCRRMRMEDETVEKLLRTIA
jgi:hypothetical protein